MTTTVTQNVITLLKQDHAGAKAALERFEAQPRDEWGTLFQSLSEMLVRHEVAEEVVVYPAIRKLPGGAELADEKLAEQDEAERTLVAMERMDPHGDDFAKHLAQLKESVLAHASGEESGPFALLERDETPERLAELGAKYASAKEAAPTHPHPHAPNTPPGNTVAGPVAAMFDHVRDSLRGFFESN